MDILRLRERDTLTISMSSPKAPTTLAELELLLGKIGEGQQLEYKSAGACEGSDKAKREITKDVSAMANAAGGIIIFGIKEYDDDERSHLPEKITPIDSAKYSREWLDQVVGTIQPRIDGLKITDVHVGPKPTDFCYVVEIPQGKTAHQATDHRYHKRRNFEVTSMPDYEVRDVMNRRSKPSVSIQIKINAPHLDRLGQVLFGFSNQSSNMAKYIGATVKFPLKLSGRIVHFDDATLDTENGESFWQFYVKGGFSHPLFPKSKQIFSIPYKFASRLDPEPPKSISEVQITVFADDMEPVSVAKDVSAAFSNWT